MPAILSAPPFHLADIGTKICEQYTPLVEGMVERLHVPAALRDDARQEGFIGLLTAVERYDTTSPVHFAVFAKTYVMGAITRRIYNRTQMIEIATEAFGVEGSSATDRVETTPAYEIESQVLMAVHLEAWMATLSATETCVLRRLHWEDRTTDDVAAEIGVSRRRVNQIHLSLLRRGADALVGEG